MREPAQSRDLRMRASSPLTVLHIHIDIYIYFIHGIHLHHMRRTVKNGKGCSKACTQESCDPRPHQTPRNTWGGVSGEQSRPLQKAFAPPKENTHHDSSYYIIFIMFELPTDHMDVKGSKSDMGKSQPSCEEDLFYIVFKKVTCFHH